MRQATGYSLHPAYFSTKAPHALKGADGPRTINEKLDELRLAAAKACRRLQDEGQLRNAALAPLLKAAVTVLTGRAPRPSAKAPLVSVPAASDLSALLLTQQPMRQVLAAWQADNSAYLAKAYLTRSKQYVD
ncbi:MAG: hypothetical protein ACRYFK_12260 [Janthinobacterium lividum]